MRSLPAAAALIVLVSSSVPAQERAISLQGAIQLALERNPAMSIARAGVAAGSAGVTTARAPLLPRLDYNESFARSDNPVFVFGTLLNQGRFGEENFAIDALNGPSAVSLYQSRFVLQQTLFAGGQNYLELDRAELGEEGALEAERQTRMNVIFAVVRAYHGAQVAEAGLAVVEAARGVAEEDFRRAEALFDAGMASEADLLSLRVHLADIEQQVIAATSAVEIERAELNDVLGEPLDRSLALVTPLMSATSPASAQAREELETVAMAQHPEMRQTSLNLEAASLGERQAKAAFLPSVALQGGWESDRVSFTGPGSTNWMIGLSLRLNLFNGLADRGRLQQAQAGLVRAQARRDEVENRLRLELRRALVERVAANKKLSVAEGAVDQARESHRITQARFEGGLTSVTDLLRSETALLSAEARHLGALYETKLTEVGLELAMGTLDQSSEAFQR